MSKENDKYREHIEGCGVCLRANRCEEEIDLFNVAMNTMATDTFTRAYIEAALWSSSDDNGQPLDKAYGLENISKETLREISFDAQAFSKENSDFIKDSKQAGHDFWLTRNGHGAGFDDGDYPERVAYRLTKSAQSYGEYHLYVGDDGLIHGMTG